MLKKVFGLLAVGGFVVVCFVGFRSGTQRQSDFAGYYTAAKIVATTDSISRMYDNHWFVSQMHSYGISESTFIMYVNPPSVAFVMTPFVMLQPRDAKLAWNAFNVLFLVIAFLVLRRLFNFPIDSLHAAIVVMLLSGLPFLRNLQHGQLYVMMLVLVVLLLQGYVNNKPILTGVALATLLILKYFGWIFLLLFIVERNWRALASTAVFLCLGTLIVGGFVGIDTYKAHLDVLLAAARRDDFATTGLPCIPALFGALFVFHARWNANVVDDLPWLASLLTVLSLAALLTFTLRKTENMDSLRISSAILVLSVLFTPLAAEHHFMLLVVPAVYLLMQYRLELSNFWSLAAIGSLLILVFGWYPSIRMNTLDGWTKLLAFPRLFAALSLWLLLITPIYRRRS